MAKYKKTLFDKIKISDSLEISHISPAGAAYKQVAEELKDGTLAASNYDNRLIEVLEQKVNEQGEIARIRFWFGLFVGAFIALISNVLVFASFKWLEPNIYQEQYFLIGVVAFIILVITISGLIIWIKWKRS